MALSITETRAVLLASLVIVMSEAVGIGEVTQSELELQVTVEVAQTEQVAASESRGLRADLLVAKIETVRASATPQVGLDPLFISVTDRLKVWEWRVFPLGEHEVYGVPIRIFMKGRI